MTLASVRGYGTCTGLEQTLVDWVVPGGGGVCQELGRVGKGGGMHYLHLSRNRNIM